jgi:hypothetical protein
MADVLTYVAWPLAAGCLSAGVSSFCDEFTGVGVIVRNFAKTHFSGRPMRHR